MAIKWRITGEDSLRLPCRVYRNLTKKTWSIVALQGPNKGKVVAHGEDFILSDAIPIVNESGRQRVIRTKRKTVHAYLQGTIFLWAQAWTQGSYPQIGRQVSYNPYQADHFFYPDNHERLTLGGIDLYFSAQGTVHEVIRPQ